MPSRVVPVIGFMQTVRSVSKTWGKAKFFLCLDSGLENLKVFEEAWWSKIEKEVGI